MLKVSYESRQVAKRIVFVGEEMKQFKQPLLTILIIFATAYVLSLIGCAPSDDRPGGSVVSTPVQRNENDNLGNNINELKQIDPVKMPVCKDSEFAALQNWSAALASAESAIKLMGDKSSSWKKKDDVVKLAQKAIFQCDQLQYYHSQNPCKKIVGQNIVNPKGVLKAYDGFRIHQRCELSNQYLVQFGVRSQPALPPSASVNPDPNSSADARDIHECNDLEFSKLKIWRASLDQANKNIAKLGDRNSWKYDPNAIESSKAATQVCESLISYHQDQPCKRYIKNDKTNASELKIYSVETLHQQCETARTYQYEFAQHDSNLIMPNAKLFFDASVIAGMTIDPGYSSGKLLGQCIISNQSPNTITYGNEKVLIKEARVYPSNGIEGYQMFVMVTAEGIKFECYGLDYSSAKTSKNEVVRLLKQKQTNISLSYKLN